MTMNAWTFQVKTQQYTSHQLYIIQFTPSYYIFTKFTIALSSIYIHTINKS